MPIKKQFLKTKPICKVTFHIPEQECQGALTAHVIGDFNDWSTDSAPMKRLKRGGFSLTLDLEKNRQYQFRYLLDGSQWTNESQADDDTPTPYGDCVNSVIIV